MAIFLFCFVQCYNAEADQDEQAKREPPNYPHITEQYVVQEGDTLELIAELFHVDVDEMLAVNPQIDDTNIIYANEILNLPSYASLDVYRHH
jgi:LysM repeat protein